ncbi:MAG: hypothetical protein HC781_03930 [Leptolyngbyaceae cyanobacterium CSU_1_4]|nr:hypothetical protein [Leptolyngbyaceae cyanobacterium CSU_1_4]
MTTNDFGFSDVDAGDSLSGIRLDTLPINGTLQLNGASVALGQIISATDIAAGQLIFIPVSNANGNNYANFTFSVRDNSGDAPSQFDTAPNTITFNVASVNDSPSGQDKAIATLEDTAHVFTPADFGFNDPDPGDALSSVRIDTVPTSGTFALNGVPVTLGQVISATDIAAGKFIFTPALNAIGAIDFTFSVKDSSSDPSTEFDPTPNQITFNIASVKDAPTGQDKTISATGGIGYPLTANDFGFADADGDAFSSVRIDTLPVNGAFQFNGANVMAGQVISTTDIAAGKLVFTVAPGTNGNNYANFTFSVKDSSGDASTEFDAVPNTITFNVASNLPPSIDLDGNNSSGITGNNYQVLYTPGQFAKIGDTDVKVTDVDDFNMESATLILTTRPNGSDESLAISGSLPSGINATAYDPLTGILKLTGSASIANYQAAIASITYQNTTVVKNTSNRTVTVMVNDGEKESTIATTTILFDSDGDRASDSSDLDDDNDGIPDLTEQNGNPTRDTDGDGILDTLDLDADNDGITDLQESGLSTVIIAILDKDNDGVIDPTQNFGGNGLSNSLETTPDSGILNYAPVDTDGDKKPNFQDLDSDNDGLSDLSESGSGYLDGNGDKMVDGKDSDGDGILDLADKGAGFGGGNRPSFKDSNNNGTPDFMEISVSPPKGSNGSDTIIGTDGDDILNGFSDLDIIYGRGGNDLINGGSDRDVLRGDEGNDTINGGTDNDNIQGGTGNDSVNGGDGNDLMLGNDGDDVLSGDRGKDKIYGGQGKDIINGSDGNDRLHGDEEDDIIRGDRGNDLLVGGLGKDELTGGQGRDIFKYRSVKEFSDIITDFEIIKDRFDLRKIFHRRGSMSNLELQQSGKDTIVGVSFKGKEYTLGLLEDVNANTLKARHFKF